MIPSLRTSALGLGVALLVATGAQAGSVFSDNFNAEAGGGFGPNYGGFANWDVSGGTVDIVPNGAFGITCFSGGSCVDLDGSTFDAGTITTKLAYDFAVGDVVTFTFFASGSQRGDVNTLFAGFTFTDPTDLGSQAAGGGFDPYFLGGPLGNIGQYSRSIDLASGAPNQLFSISFTALEAGSVRLFIGTNGGDQFGPLADDVNLDVTTRVVDGGGVPEPATWAIMLLGFGGMGAALRRRRRAIA